MRWIRRSLQICLEILIIHLQIVDAIEILALYLVNDFFFRKIVDMYLNTIIVQTQTFEIIPYHKLQKFLFQDGISGKTTKCQGYMNATLIAVADEIEYRNIRLVGILTKSSTQLL